MVLIGVLVNPLGSCTLNRTTMTDQEDNQEKRHPEQHDLERQQQDLFDELAREQAEAEQALPPNQEGSIEVSSPGKIG